MNYRLWVGQGKYADIFRAGIVTIIILPSRLNTANTCGKDWDLAPFLVPGMWRQKLPGFKRNT